MKDLRNKETNQNLDVGSLPTILKSEIHDEYIGSDHCPICLELEFPEDTVKAPE